jgi:hypothetical protein
VATFLSTRASAALLLLALGVWRSAAVQAAPQEPTGHLPVSLPRIREELAKRPPRGLGLEPDVSMLVPVATFKTGVNQRVYVLSLEEWIDREFKLTALQRQSTDWAAKCCGGYALAGGAFTVTLDPLFTKIEEALHRRRVRKIREQIARELADVEAARKLAGLPDTR